MKRIAEQLRLGYMRVVGQEPDVALGAGYADRVDARVRGKEEHLLVADPQDHTDVRVDDASVTEDPNVTVRMGCQYRLDRGIHPVAQGLLALASGCQEEDR